jgi:gas vesicle protein
MAEDPQALREDIEETRRNLTYDVDALANKVSPRQVMHRRADAVRGRLSGMKDRVMGMTEHAGSSAASTVQDAGSKVGDAVTSAPTMAKERTRGAPLAAGVVAFAAGLVVAAALPPTTKDRQLASSAKDTAMEPVKQQAGGMAQELKENLREPAQEAVQHVKESASSATEEVKEETRSAADDVKSQTQDSADAIRRNN